MSYPQRLKTTLCSLIFVPLLAGCGGAVTPSNTASTASLAQTQVGSSSLTLSPASQTVQLGSTLSFYASGGTAPYYYQISSGGGSINSSTGYFTAPTTAQSVEVAVEDSSGAWAYASVTVSTTGVSGTNIVSVSPASQTIAPGASLQFSAVGGTAPYTYSISVGGGNINSTTGLYVAPATATNAIVLVTDINGYSGSALVSVTPPVAITNLSASFGAPANQDRVSGTLAISAFAFETGVSASAISSISFTLDGVVIGAASSYPYTFSYDTTQFPNGVHTLAMAVTDVVGAVSNNAGAIQIDIENHALQTTFSAGGQGGASFTASAPAGSALLGLNLRTGSVIDQLSPIWQGIQASGPGVSYGGGYGGSGGVGPNALACSNGARVSGIFGTVAKQNNTYVIASVGLICTSMSQAGGGGTTYTSTMGGGGDGSVSPSNFLLQCPSNTFVTEVMGGSGTYLDRLQLGCQ